MHWNVPPDALPGSATFVLFWTAGLTTDPCRTKEHKTTHHVSSFQSRLRSLYDLCDRYDHDKEQTLHDKEQTLPLASLEARWLG